MKYIIFKIFLIISLLYHFEAYSKATDHKYFNHRYLSNYFSALLSYDNKDNDEALRYFNSSKYLLNKHENFLKAYVFSLVADGQVSKAIKQVNYLKKKENSNFFEAKLLLALHSVKKRNFVKTSKYLLSMKGLYEEDSYEYIIYHTLKSYNQLFINKSLDKKEHKFGRLSLINFAFQNCYLNSEQTNSNFIKLINTPDGDYSRYLFFYLTNLLKIKDYNKALDIVEKIDPLNSSLIISQSKKWVDKKKFENFNKFFSCNSESDLLAEFFFLIGSIYSSQEDYERSNFYLNISNYLNPKFNFNLSLLAENYYLIGDYESTKKVLNKLNTENKIYEWYKIKRVTQIIESQKGKDKSIQFIENKFKKINDPSIKILFDMGTIYKNNKKFKKAIEYYSEVLSRIDENSKAFADTLYRRGGSYERIGNYKMSDRDLLKSLEINPGEPYVLNYLAYSWLERNYKIQEAISMLQKAYKQKKNDPYIIDSVGWGYYLIGDYINAEKYLKLAVQLMPDDPIVNDHYGDTLWMLDQKLQAKYFWKNVLNLEETQEEMKNKIKQKLLFGPDKT